MMKNRKKGNIVNKKRIKNLINETLIAVWYKESQVLRGRKKGKKYSEAQKQEFESNLFATIKRLIQKIEKK